MKRLTSSSLASGADEMSFQVGSELKPLVSEAKRKKCKGNQREEEKLILQATGSWLSEQIKQKKAATKQSDVAAEKNEVLKYARNKPLVDSERAEKMVLTKVQTKEKKRKLSENFKGSSLSSL